MFDTIEIDLCEDCMLLTANGESGEDDGGEARAERMVENLARTGDRHRDLSVSCGDCDHGFRTFTCGACGDLVAGTAHEGVILRPIA